MQTFTRSKTFALNSLRCCQHPFRGVSLAGRSGFVIFAFSTPVLDACPYLLSCFNLLNRILGYKRVPYFRFGPNIRGCYGQRQRALPGTSVGTRGDARSPLYALTRVSEKRGTLARARCAGARIPRAPALTHVRAQTNANAFTSYAQKLRKPPH